MAFEILGALLQSQKHNALCVKNFRPYGQLLFGVVLATTFFLKIVMKFV
jgi:hypothetical protein